MSRASGWLATLLVGILALGGCSGDADDPAADRGEHPADLRSALLTLDDMPPGWVAAPYDAESEANVCPAEVAGPLGLDREPPTAGAQYAASLARGPSFSEAIQVAPPGRGSELLPIVRDAMADCDGDVYGGRPARVSELDFPHVGDESAAYTIRLAGVAIHALYVVTGDIAITMSSYDLSGGDPIRLLETYAEPAVDKAEAVLR
jgi:hypothetical protein